MVWKIAVWGLIGLCLLAVVRLVMLAMLSRTPPGLGLEDGRLLPCPGKANCVSSTAKGRAHGIPPIAFSGKPAEAMDHARETIGSMKGGRVVSVDGNYLRAEFSSTLFRFVDDLELLWDPSLRQFDVRSGSRVGHSDLGANRRRVDELRRRLDRPPSSQDRSQND
jgi:uncharacterized protein (DUF1499 family)